MKVTTELKNIIKSNFAKRKDQCLKEEVARQEQEYKTVCKTIEDSDEYRKLLEAIDNFNKRFGERELNFKVERSYYVKSVFQEMCNLKPENFIGKPYRRCDSPEYKAQIEELENQQNALLVKLTYEKDLDKIKETLLNYGITLD